MTTEVIDSHGSFIVRGPRYSVLQCRGPVSHRQQLARRSGCRAYVEQHLNAAGSVSPNYSTAIVGPGCERSRAMAREYTRLCAAEFRIRDGGALVGHRGFGNVANAGCPHFLAEPGFVSNPEFAGIARTGEGIDAMARCLAQAIRTHIPGASWASPWPTSTARSPTRAHPATCPRVRRAMATCGKRTSLTRS